MNSARLRRSCAVLVATLTPILASAGTRFDFKTEVSGYSYSGRMSIDRDRSRTDITEGSHPLFNPSFSIITRKAGQEIVVLDHERRTYFVRRTESLGGHLATARGLGRATASKARARKSRTTTGETVGGSSVERHTVNVSYELMMEIAGEKLKATVELDVRFDVIPNIDQRALPWGLQYAAKTGFEDVDREIADRLPDRLPLRQVVTASRRIEDGPVVTETINTTISNVRSEAMTDDDFLAPHGYVYKEPVFEFGQ